MKWFMIEFRTLYGVEAKNRKEAIRQAKEILLNDLGGFDLEDLFDVEILKTK